MEWKQTKKWLKLTAPVGLAIIMAACGGKSDDKKAATSPSAVASASASPSGSASASASPSASASASPSTSASASTQPATPTASDVFKTYKNAANGVSIEYPGDWTLKENIAGAVAAFLTPVESDSDTFQENVNLVIQDLGGEKMDLKQYTDITKQQLEQLITDYKLISAETIEENDGLKVQSLVYSGKQGQYELAWQQLFFIKNGKAYVLSYTAAPESFNKYAEMVGKMVGSMTLG